jgi:hypothetical protein
MGLAGMVAGCEASGVPPTSGADSVSQFKPDYRGVQTHLLDNDLVSFQVTMAGARSREDVDRYAECAAAQYTLIRGFGFARHLRTNVVEEAGIWRGDAIYTISPALPDGVKKLDAEVVAADCAENGIPMV